MSQTKPFVPKEHFYTVLPISILIASLIIGGAILLGAKRSTHVSATPAQETDEELAQNVRPVSLDDHIQGNKNAPVKIVEYSDLDCPFCANVHQTLYELVEKRGNDVAWVYRHFPLDKPGPSGRILHPDAGTKSHATECAAELGGEDAFWAYTDILFARQQEGIGILDEIATTIGLNEASFKECMNSDRHTEKIEDDYQNATASGGTGTPFNVIIAADGTAFPISGAIPLSVLEQIVDAALQP